MIPSFSQINSDLKSNKLSLSTLVDNVISLINQKVQLNAFIEVFEESAQIKALEVSNKIKEGKAGRLAGMVIAIKDNICYKDHELTASSAILKGFISLFSATVVERLLQEDAIIIGRLGCDEFAMGSSSETSIYGAVKNPHDQNKVPGGSSGGASAAVSAGLCHIAIGSDTGGSIRQPASFTGTIGLKPTYGRVSRHGLLAYASSFDQIGPIGTDISDVALVTEIISGRDEFDSTVSFERVGNYAKLSADTSKKRFAYYKSYVDHEGLDTEIRKHFFEVLDSLKKLGHEIVEKEFEYLDQMVPTYYVLTTAEASSNLARYDGMRFGYRSHQPSSLNEAFTKSRSEGFGKEVKRRIMLGTYVLSAGYYDAYYTKGQKVRRIIRKETLDLFKEVDFIISPTSPHTAFNIDSQIDDPIKMYLEDIFTVQANISGIPAISLPLGNHSNGLPFGFQLMADSFKEDELISMSAEIMNNNRLEE